MEIDCLRMRTTECRCDYSALGSGIVQASILVLYACHCIESFSLWRCACQSGQKNDKYWVSVCVNLVRRQREIILTGSPVELLVRLFC